MPRINYYKIPCTICGGEFLNVVHEWPDGHTYEADKTAYRRAYKHIWG